MGGSKSKALGHYTTADEALAAFPESAKGKNVLITGARVGGLGWETARALAKGGANVIITCRSKEHSDEAIQKIKEAVPDAKVSAIQLDLADLKSVREAANEFNAKGIPLNVLINNAGVMACPLGYTKNGFENQIGTNHLVSTMLEKRLGGASRRLHFRVMV